MLRERRYRAAVLFAQQSVEKIIKAYIIEYKGVMPRKTHIIEDLIKDAKLDLKEIDNIKIEELSKAYVRVRYEDLSQKHYKNSEQVKPLVIMAKKVHIWIEKKLTKS